MPLHWNDADGMRLSIQPREVHECGHLTPDGSVQFAGGTHHEICVLTMTVIWSDDGFQLELHDHEAPGAQPIELSCSKEVSAMSREE